MSHWRHPSIIVILTLLGVQFLGADTYAQQPAKKKNVLVLLADDMGWGDVGYHGGIADTPNIDSLAAEGIRLNRFYAYPACSPARAAMLTGRFPGRYGIVGPVRPRDTGLPVNEVVLPALFQSAGYQTSLIGKWHLGHAADQQTHPIARGFDHFYGFVDASIDYFKHTTSRGMPDWQRNGKPVVEEGYSTDLLTDEAITRIKNRNKAKPFCIVVAYNAPHSPFQAPEKLIAKYTDRAEGRQAVYAAMIDSMDAGIGRILKTIDQEDLRDETVVVFASDNGAARMGTNAPLRGQKRQVFEGGIRVPCAIRAPGAIKPGTISNQVSAIHDLFPTLAEAAGVSLESLDDRTLDGQSLWTNLTSGIETDRNVVIAEADFALIGPRWKIIQPERGAAELYDLTNDESETTDVARKNAAVLAKMIQQINQFKTEIGNEASAPRETNPVPPSTMLIAKNAPTEGHSLKAAQLKGDAIYSILGDKRIESIGNGIRLLSHEDHDGDGHHAGVATFPNQPTTAGKRWYRFYITALAQDGFAVDNDDLYLKVEFLNGDKSLDYIKTRIYPQVLRERADLKDTGTNKNLGLGTWRTYAMDFRTPFAEVDAVKPSVGFVGGKGATKRSEFFIRSMSVEPIDAPADYKRPVDGIRDFPQPDPASLVHLGGRWYYNPKDGDKKLPKRFDYTNADQLLYKSDRFESPFAGNMSSWLRAGYKNFAGELVQQDEPRPFCVVISITEDHIVVKSRNLPNHPTATFPDRWRRLDGNPAYIQERADTWHLPIHPKVDPDHIAMTLQNENRALPGGPIGVATNGVVFFNPFDHIFETDAVWRLDRCCGHPSPQSQYHYHKYPVCVKTPWSDEGKGHSSVIGFAFDGYPVYGPYESTGLLARDDTKNPLNDFNLHEDNVRGPHYHVTPGKFPHIIGGFWGELESLNRPSRRPR